MGHWEWPVKDKDTEWLSPTKAKRRQCAKKGVMSLVLRGYLKQRQQTHIRTCSMEITGDVDKSIFSSGRDGQLNWKEEENGRWDSRGKMPDKLLFCKTEKWDGC